MFPSAYLLRKKYPDVARPFTIPGGNRVMLACSGLITFWVVLGSVTAVFPGGLNHAFGIGYSIKDEWGVSGATFFGFTLGTLAVITAVSIAGYFAAGNVRSKTVEVTIAGGSEIEPAMA